MLFELAENLAENLTIAQRQQSGDILEQESFRLELFEEAHEILEKLVTRVTQKPGRGVNREALARWASGEKINLAFLQAKPGPYLSGFDTFNSTRITPGFRVVQ